MIDTATFRANQARVTWEERSRFANQHVVWSEAGDAILFGDADLGRLFRRMDEAGLSGDTYLVSFIDGAESGEYGAAGLFAPEDE